MSTVEIKKGNQPLTLKGMFFSFVKDWLLIIVMTMIAGIGGILYATFQKAQFESRLTFALDEGGSSESGGIAGLAAQFGLSLGSGSNDVFGGENITEIMSSRRMIERVLLSVDTINNTPTTLADMFTKVFQKKWSKKSGIPNIKFPVGISKEQLSYYQDSILYCMYKEISSTLLSAGRPDKKLNVFEVKFKSPDEVFTKKFTDKIVQETSTFYTELRTKKSKQTLEILEERVAYMKGSLNNSISSKAGIQDANLNPAFASAQAPLQKQQVNIQVFGGAYAELYKNMELARYQFLKEVPLLQIIDPADYPMKRIKPGRLKTAIYFSSIFLLAALVFVFVFKNNSKKIEN